MRKLTNLIFFVLMTSLVSCDQTANIKPLPKPILIYEQQETSTQEEKWTTNLRFTGRVYNYYTGQQVDCQTEYNNITVEIDQDWSAISLYDETGFFLGYFDKRTELKDGGVQYNVRDNGGFYIWNEVRVCGNWYFVSFFNHEFFGHSAFMYEYEVVQP